MRRSGVRLPSTPPSSARKNVLIFALSKPLESLPLFGILITIPKYVCCRVLKILSIKRSFGCRVLPCVIALALTRALAQSPQSTTTTSASDSNPDPPKEFFLQKVHPLLEQKCFGCHGEPKDREGEFD